MTRSPAHFVPRLAVLEDRTVPSLLTTLASAGGDGAPTALPSVAPALSGNGRFVAFVTAAALAPDDTNGLADVYLKDRTTAAVTLVSRGYGLAGVVGNAAVDPNSAPSVSADGRFVAFASAASNLVSDDTNGRADVFVRDTISGTTRRVSVDTLDFRAPYTIQGDGDSFAPTISADGSQVCFLSDATTFTGTYPKPAGVVYAYVSGRGVRLNEVGGYSPLAGANADGPVDVAVLSGDGGTVAFVSRAANLVAGDTNAVADVFVKDLASGAVSRVSVASDGTQANGASFASSPYSGVGISGDGRFVAFQSQASNLVGPSDTNGHTDVFVRFRGENLTWLISGYQANADSRNPVISGNGRVVAFESFATNLVPGDTNGFKDVFAWDRSTSAVSRVSVSTGGAEANGPADNPAISRDGQFVAFAGTGTNLVAPATQGSQVFVAQRPQPLGLVIGSGVGSESKTEGRGSVPSPTNPYPGFTGGTLVARGDVNGDGSTDTVTSTGAGGTAHIQVFDSLSGSLVASFYGYPPAFTGGVNVSVGDVNGDGYADIACGVGGGGGPNVRIFDGKQILAGNYTLQPVSAGGALICSFYAYPEAFTGGVRVATADVNADGFADVVCAVGSGGGPNVRVLDGRQLALGNTSLGEIAQGGALISSFYGLPSSFTGGLFVSAGDVNNDGFADVIVGVESGGGPNVRAFDARTFGLLLSIYALDPALTGGVRVASTDWNADGYDDLVVGTGPGATGRQVRVISGKDGSTELASILPFSYRGTSTLPGGSDVSVG